MHVTDYRAAAGAARRQREIERPAHRITDDDRDHRSLSPGQRQRTSTAVPDLFDMKLRARRRDRAARAGPELFLHGRAFEDCLERIMLVDQRFDRALLIGCPDPAWPERVGTVADQVAVRDPGRLFAGRAGGQVITEDAWDPAKSTYDLVLNVGTLDSVNDLRLALHLIRYAMAPGGLFIGAVSGGDTLPQLRAAMRAADTASGAAAPHVHPRIEASALGPLLADAAFLNPVVDVDRVVASYPSFEGLVSDLRAMGATNILATRPHFVGKSARAAAMRAFRDAGDGERTVETFEIIHFAAWTAKES